MRNLGFEVNISENKTDKVSFFLHVGPGFTSSELIDDGIIGKSGENFANILSDSKNIPAEYNLSTISEREIHISFSASLLSRLWQIASVLNLIDGATFLGDEDDPFIERVVVKPGTLENVSLESMYGDLKAYLEHCRATMTNFLPEDFEVDEYIGRQWPDTPSDYMYDILMRPSRPMSQAAQDTTKAFLLNFDQLMAESAFEPDTSPEEWLEDGAIPYPVEITVAASSISYRIEMPPTDFSPGLLMVSDVLEKRYDLAIASWEFSIREGW